MQINSVNTSKVVDNYAKTTEKVLNTAKEIVKDKKTNLALLPAVVSGAYIALKANKKPLERDFESEKKMKKITNSPEEFRKAMRLAKLDFEDAEIKTIINDEKLFNRAIELKNLGLTSKTIKDYIYKLNDNEFNNYISLAKSGMLSNGTDTPDKIQNDEYLKEESENLKKIIYYTKLGIPDKELKAFTEMNEDKRNEILRYMFKGSKYEKAKEILEDSNKEEIIGYIDKGISPGIAYNLSKLPDNKKEEFFSLIENGASPTYALRISRFKGAKEKLYKDITSLGLKPHIAADITNLDLIAKSKVLNPQITNDITMLLKDELYKKDNIKLEDIFVKRYSKKDEAIKDLKTGDTCRIADSEKVHIKKVDGTLEEINLSAKKYMELFPPVTRFAISQGAIGDCFLISTLDAAFKNPKTRVNILRCFNENENGDVTVKYPKSDITFTVKNGKKVDDYIPEFFNDIRTNSERSGKTSTISGSDGIRMLEYLYGKVSQDRDIKYFNSHIDTTWEKIQRATEDYQFDNLHDDLMKYFMIRKLNILTPEQSRIGGRSYNVMDTLGLKKAEMYLGDYDEGKNFKAKDGRHGAIVVTSSFDKGLEKIKKENDKLLILAGTMSIKDANPRGLVGPHAYELEVVKDKDGTPVFRITNPHNSTSSIDLNEAEFKKYFAKIYTAEVGD